MEMVRNRTYHILHFPTGWRFKPTDEELVVHYLKKKVFSPCQRFVPDLDRAFNSRFLPDLDHAFSSNPWDLPGDLREKRHFFCKRRCNMLKNSRTDSGYWKAIGKDKQITIPGNNFMVGVKKLYVFYQERKLKTQWVMQEFSLSSLNSPPSTQKVMMQVGDWVVCRLYQRNKRARKKKAINKLGKRKRSSSLSAHNPSNVRIDELRAVSCSCSSVITEVSCNDNEDQEVTSF